MGFKTRKSIKLPGGVRVNLSQKGVGVSVGVKGLRVSTGPAGTKLHTSVPGAGIRSSMSLGGRSSPATAPTKTNTSNPSCASVTGIGCLAIIGIAVAIKLASLLWATLFTIWFWLILAPIALGYAARRVYFAFNRQRLEKRFFDALSALSSSDTSYEPLWQLAVELPGEADVSVLLATQRASAGEVAGALAAVETALAHVDTLGSLSGGLTLRFPGIVAALSFAPENGGTNALYLVRNHLFVQLGRAHEVGALPPMAPGADPALRALQLVTAADSNVALGNIEGALGNLEEALSIGALTSLETALRYKYAQALEKANLRERAIVEYTHVVHAGGYEDAEARRDLLVDAHDNEQFALTLQRVNTARTAEEIRAILGNALLSIKTSQAQERLRTAAARIEADLLARKRAELEAFEEQLVLESIDRLGRTEEHALRETIRQGTVARLTDVSRKQHFQQEATRIEESAQERMRAKAEEAQAAQLKAAEEREERAFTMGLEEMDIALTPETLVRARDTARRLITSPSRRASFETAADKKIKEVQARWEAKAEALDIAAFDRTVAKMAAARGAAGRRSALEAGLREITNSQKREQLMAEASRIEVEAVLEKVDGLKTAAAKKRNLLAGLEALRNDNVPDELQAKQIQWLEAALAEVEGRAK